LVANTVKHAEGRSAEKLRKKRPELFTHPVIRKLRGKVRDDFFPPLRLPLAGEGLFVTEEILSEYISTAVAFLDTIASHFETQATEYYPVE
jgi:hypothetical protein